MTHSSQAKSANVTGILTLALIVALLAGALLVRLVGDEGATGVGDPSAGTNAEENRASGSPAGPLREGSPAPDFTLLDPAGEPVALDDWRGRPVLINFWATWCGPCEVEMPAIQAAYDAHQQDGLVVLAVAVDDTVANVRGFFAEKGLTFQALMDDGTVSRLYQVFGLPTSFFVGADGNIVARHIGMLNGTKINEYLTAALVEDRP